MQALWLFYFYVGLIHASPLFPIRFRGFKNQFDWQSGVIKITKKALVTYLIGFVAFSGVGLGFLFNPFWTKQAEAAWFNDSWAFRKRIDVTVTSTATDRTSVDTLLTVDTNLGSSKLQSACEDLRFTSVSGTLLPYYIPDTTSCNSNGTNKIWVRADLVPKNTTTYTMYMYYGNPSAIAGSDAQTMSLYNGLVGYWKLNEASGNASDNSVNSNTLTNNNTATYAAGQFANSASFASASSQSESIADASQTGLDNMSAQTISVWVNPTTLDDNSHMVIKDSSNSNCSYRLTYSGTGEISYISCSNGFYGTTSTSGAILSTGSWQHIVLTNDGTTLRLYKNGVEQISGSFPSSLGSSIENTTSAFSIGGGTHNGATSYMNGKLDDVRVYNRALSATEVGQLYTGPGGTPYLDDDSTKFSASLGSEEKGLSPVAYWKLDEGQGPSAEDSTSHGLDGTLNNTPTYQTENFCVASKCLWFDGANNENVSRADDPKLDFAAADSFTVSAWVKRNGVSSAANYILAKADTTNGGYKLWMDDSGDLCFGVDDDASWTPDDSACTSAIDYDDSQWHFVVGVKSGTSSITLFVDGSQRAQDASIAATGTLANTNTFYIGVDRDGTSNEWLGFIDEVKVYNQALSAAQLKADYNARGNPDGVSAVLGANIQNIPGALSNGLVGYWKMDETSWTNDCATATVLDASGNGNNAKSCPNTTGPTGGGAGKFGKGGSFDGANDALQVPNSASLNSADTNWTISGWFYDTAGDYNHGPGTLIMKQNDDGSANAPFNATIAWHNFVIGGEASFSDTNITYDLDANGYSTNTWIQFVGTYDAAKSEVSLYLNGKLVAGPTVITPPGSNSDVVEIGGKTAHDSDFAGKLDEFRIYNRTLSGAEVSQLYNWAPGPVGYWKMDEGSGPTAYDSSGQGQNGTITAGTGSYSDGKYGKGYNFDGSTTVVNNGSASNLDNLPYGAMTASMWINPSRVSACDTLISKDPATWYLKLVGCGSASLHGYIVTNGTSASTITSNFLIGTGDWQYVTMTYDNSGDRKIRIYINGVEASYGTQTAGTGTVVDDSSVDLRLGYRGSEGFYSGKMDEVKVYNYVRTQTQIIEDMNAGHPAPGSPVGSAVAHWKLDEGFGTTANDSSINRNDLTLNTASWTNSGKFGKAWNGTGGNIRMSRSTDADLEFAAADSFAVTLWYKSDAAGNPGSTEYLVSDTAGNADVGFNIYANTSGNLCFGIDDDTTWGPDVSSCTTTDVYDGNWHHLAAVRDTGADKTYIYIDSQEKDSDTDTTSATLDGDNTFFVGDIDTNDDGEEFAGDIDEINVYRSSLTAEQVKLDMNQKAGQVVGSLSSTQSNPNSADSLYCVPGDSTSCSGPVAEWNFDEASGDDPVDSSGNGNQAFSCCNQWKYSVGKINKAIEDDQGGGVMSAGSGSSLDDLSAGGLTVEGWIYPYTEGVSNQGIIVTKQFWGIGFNGSATNAIDFGVSHSGTDLFRSTSDNAVTLNRWNHVSVTWDGSTTAANVHIYINGKEASYQTTTNATGTPDSDAAEDFTIMGDSGQGNKFDGKLDSLRVFNYARTPAQIAWDYNRGAPIAQWKFDECQGTSIRDSMGIAGVGTLTIGAGGEDTVGTCATSSTAWGSGAAGKVNYSLSFDGTDDNVTIPDSPLWDFGANNFTVAWWEYRTSNVNGKAALVRDGTDTYPPFVIGYSNNAANLQIYITSDGASWDIANAESLGPVTLNQWVHLAVTRNGNTFTAFKNGVQTDSWTSSSAINSSSGALRIAGPYTAAATDYFYAGQLDDIKIFNYGLTAEQIKNLITGGTARFGPSAGAP